MSPGYGTTEQSTGCHYSSVYSENATLIYFCEPLGQGIFARGRHGGKILRRPKSYRFSEGTSRSRSGVRPKEIWSPALQVYNVAYRELSAL